MTAVLDRCGNASKPHTLPEPTFYRAWCSAGNQGIPEAEPLFFDESAAAFFDYEETKPVRTSCCGEELCAHHHREHTWLGCSLFWRVVDGAKAVV
jgi:hypothetical protein